MSKIQLAFDTLSSVTSRQLSSGSDIGIRNFGGGESDGGFLSTLVNLFKGAAGWIMNFVSSAFSWTWTQLWGRFVQSVSFLYNFNWNATDQQLDQLVANQINVLSGMLGGTLGNLLGWITCGLVPAAGILYFNEPLGIKLLQDVGEEALDEFLSNMQVLCNQAALSTVQMWAITLFKAERRLIKAVAKNPKVAQVIGEKNSKIIESWGAEGSKPWSFRSAVEEAIESIESDWLQNFVEEGYEEFLDACVEAGYVVAGGIDDWAVKQNLQNQSILGKERTIEVTLNREIPEERIIISGSESVVRTALTNTIASYQLVENRDIGQFVGDTVRSQATKEKSELTLLLQWAFYESPPFRRNNKDLVQCRIPGIDRSKIDWDQIKLAMGGSNGYTWGRYKAYFGLSNSLNTFADKAILYASNPNEADDRLTALMGLSDYIIQTKSVTEELNHGRRSNGKALHKESAQIYPAYMTLINSQKVLNEENGTTERTGTYKRKRDRIEMFVSQKPYNFDEIIAEILSTTGSNV